jgi:AcrR family transcriptional regulator
VAADTREPWREDPRAERVAERLRDVVLTLAATRPIGAVGVAEISRLADISRSTFYKHAPTPAALLKRLLAEELERVSADTEARLRGGEQNLRELSRTELAALLAVVRRHEQIYRLTLSENGSPELHRLLVDHIREGVRMVFRYSRLTPPAGSGAGTGDDQWEFFAAFVAGAYVEVIAAWLRETTPRPAEAVIEILLATLPAWMLEGPPTGTDHAR